MRSRSEADEVFLAASKTVDSYDAEWLRQLTSALLSTIPLEGRSFLDVGGGSGMMSYYASSQGASRVVCLEPTAAGSNTKMDEQFRSWGRALPSAVKVQRVQLRLEDFTAPPGGFDVILLNSVINHIDEEACSRLPKDSAARRSYRRIFRSLGELAAPGADVVIADAARRNAWGTLGLRSPFARSIEWRLHAQPSTWVDLAEREGFIHTGTSWRPPVRLGRPGRALASNAVGAWLTNSMFVSRFRWSA